MTAPKLTVVIPTHDRPEKLGETISALSSQRDLDPADYELIVVDDGSIPPVTPEQRGGGPNLRVMRVEGEGPSAARNNGAAAANGELLVFVDDDVGVVPGFLASHWRAHLEWPGALQVGLICLPETAIGTPFGRFRQDLEDN